MGFYSFYRIIKDVIRTLFGSKLWKFTLIFLIVFTLLFALGQKGVFAVSNNVISIPNVGNLTLKDWYDNYYWIIYAGYKDGSSWVQVFIADKEFTVFQNGDYLRASGNITKYSTTASAGDLMPLSWFNNKLNKDEPTLTSSTNPVVGNGNFLYVSKFSNFDVKYTNGNIYLSATNPRITYPEITTPVADLENLDFDYIAVEANDWSDKIIYALFYDRNNMTTESTEGLYPVKEIPLSKEFYSDYLNNELSTSTNSVFWIPNNATGLYFVKNGNYEIRLAERIYSEDGGGGFRDENKNYSYSYLGDAIAFAVSDSVSDDRLKLLNNASKELQDKQRHDETIGAINKQTQATQDLNNSITDSNVTTDIELPTDTTENPTENGLNNIFDIIYNGFTQGQAQDIVFPIPYTNKSLKIEPNYLQDVLNNNNAQWVITIIQAFWWYLISRFIIKDISKKIQKIKSGNIENIQNNNIKEDML